MNRMTAQTARNLNDLRSVSQPKAPAVAYAPASGAVVALVNPAANRPMLNRTVAYGPASGRIWSAILLTSLIWVPTGNAAAAVTRMAMVIAPPMMMESIVSARDSGNSSGPDQRSWTLPACRNRL